MIAVLCISTILFCVAFTGLFGDKTQKLKAGIPVLAWLVAELTPFILPAVLGVPLALFLKLGSVAYAIRLFQSARVDRMVRMAEE